MPDDAIDIDALYRRYNERLRRYARRWTDDPTVAEDIVQQTFLYAVRSQDQLTVGPNLRGWLRSTTWRIAYRLHVDAPPTDPLDTASNLHSPAANVPLLEREGEILWALDPRFRRLLILKYVLGFRVREIAELEHSNVDSVAYLLDRARKELARLRRRAKRGWPLPALILARFRASLTRYPSHVFEQLSAVSPIAYVLAVVTAASLVVAGIAATAGDQPPSARPGGLAAAASSAARTSALASTASTHYSAFRPYIPAASVSARSASATVTAQVRRDQDSRRIDASNYTDFLPDGGPGNGELYVIVYCDGYAKRIVCAAYDTSTAILPPIP
jgi:RNA polymerase sigma-70 factor (ECF subfamily)